MCKSRCPRAVLSYSLVPRAVTVAACLACLAGIAAARDLPVGGLCFSSPAGWTVQPSGQAWRLAPPAGPPPATGSNRTSAPAANRGIVGKWSTLS